MKFDFIFDTVCPWCYIGKRRFERALSSRPMAGVQLRWRPFLLNPDMPAEGIDRRSYLDRKIGPSTRVQRMQSAAIVAGREEGIAFDFSRIHHTPNTVNSHRLISLADQVGKASEAVDAVFRAYFCQGRDIGRLDELAAIGAEVGLDPDRVTSYLRSNAEIASLMNETGRLHRLGVNGVPCIILDGTYALAGAQEAEIVLRFLDVIRDGEVEAPLSAIQSQDFRAAVMSSRA